MSVRVDHVAGRQNLRPTGLQPRPSMQGWHHTETALTAAHRSCCYADSTAARRANAGRILMKAKIFYLLFALPFLGVGVWMGYLIANDLIDASTMKMWKPAQANLQKAGYERHSGDDSDTYKAYAQYTYIVGGRLYTGNRVSIARGADNIGNYQIDLGNRLSHALSRGETVTIYVNPDDPSVAVVDRSIRWGLIGFKSIFLFVFGGVGLGLTIFVMRLPKD